MEKGSQEERAKVLPSPTVCVTAQEASIVPREVSRVTALGRRGPQHCSDCLWALALSEFRQVVGLELILPGNTAFSVFLTWHLPLSHSSICLFLSYSSRTFHFLIIRSYIRGRPPRFCPEWTSCHLAFRKETLGHTATKGTQIRLSPNRLCWCRAEVSSKLAPVTP